jgi:Pyridoxamine 5'-phosphate oxidase
MEAQDLKNYFENTTGHGVLATADAKGMVNQAVFARPHSMDDGTVSFIMPNRLTHKNLQENPHAAYLFMESGPGYKGKRLYLTKVREEQDTELLYSLRRRTYPEEKEKQEGPRFLVFFRVDQVLPLIGPGTKGV